MSTVLGLSVALATISIFSYLRFPESTLPTLSALGFRPQLRRKAFDANVWPDVVDDLASAIRAGLSLPQAMMLIAESGPEPIKPIFKQAMQRYQVTGDFVGALKVLASLADDVVADKFTSALQIAYEVGGTDLGNLLRTLSEVIREDNKLRGEIQARQSWTVNGARLAIAAPWLTALILSTRQSALGVYTSSQGLKLLGFCFLASIFAYFTMNKIGQLPTEKRIQI